MSSSSSLRAPWALACALSLAWAAPCLASASEDPSGPDAQAAEAHYDRTDASTAAIVPSVWDLMLLSASLATLAATLGVARSRPRFAQDGTTPPETQPDPIDLEPHAQS